FQIVLRPPRWPRLSVLIPNRDRADLLRRCVDSILASGYPNCEILILENNSREAATRACYRDLQDRGLARVLARSGSFNFAAINNHGVRHSNGEMLLFLNNDVCGGQPGWVQRMAGWALVPEVGAVGAKLQFPDGTIQHGGVMLTASGLPRNADYRVPGHQPG